MPEEKRRYQAPHEKGLPTLLSTANRVCSCYCVRVVGLHAVCLGLTVHRKKIRTSRSCLRGHTLPPSSRYNSSRQYLLSILLPLPNSNIICSWHILVLFVVPKLTVSGQHKSRRKRKGDHWPHAEMMAAAKRYVVKADMWSTTKIEAVLSRVV